jgi:hypothetical protein
LVIAALVFVVPLAGEAGKARAQSGPQRFLLYAPASEVAGIAHRHGLTGVTPLDAHGHDVFRVTGRDGITPQDLLDEVRADAAVVNFELDAPGKVAEAPGLKLNNTTIAVLDALNDTSLIDYHGLSLWNSFVNQPATQRIRVAESHQRYATGAGIVAIIDTGVDPTHNLIAPALVPGYDFVHGIPGLASEWSDLSQQLISVLNNTSIGGGNESSVPVPTAGQPVVLNNTTIAVLDNTTIAVLDASRLPQVFGHGTMMAGLVRLVAPTAQIMPLKAFHSDGTAKLFDVIRAIYYATEHGASVIAMGFSMSESSVELTRAINYATSRGVIVVASVGNDGRESLTFPAAVRTTIGVGSTTANDQRSLFSNFGNALVRIAAPGESLVTAYPGQRYAAAWGTSFSAALVAGGAALLRQVDPTITPSAAVEYIGTGAVGSNLKLGAGRVDLYEVIHARATGAPPPPPPNNAPTALNDSASTTEDTPVSIDVRVNDSDADGNPLTVQSVGQPTNGTAVIATTGPSAGTVTYQPAPDFSGTDSFAYTITDGTATATAVVTVTVTAGNDGPVAANDVATTTEDSEVAIDVLANDGDPEGDAISVTGVGGPQHGSTALVTSGPNAGRVSYLPASDFVGTDVFTYTISDAHGSVATATVTVTVTAANDGPAAMNDVVNTTEDTAIVLNVLSNDTDADGDALRVVAVAQAARGSVTLLGDGVDAGKVRYTPEPNFVGTDSFTYTVGDVNGTTATAQVTLTVSNVNDAPDTADDSVSTAEDVAVTLDVRLNDSDIENDSLRVTSVGTAAFGTVVLVASGTDAGLVQYTPNVNVHGPDSFTYTIEDSQGATATGVVMVTVTPINDPPAAAGDSAAVLEDSGPNLIAVLSNDSGGPDAAETLVVTAAGPAAHGAVSLIAEGDDAGKISYTPNPNFFGSDTFTYTVSDGHGGLATAVVAVTVGNVNDAPSGAADNRGTAEDSPVVIDVRANDADPDNDPLVVLSVTQPAHGTAVIGTGAAAGQVVYTPAANFVGSDSFSYTVGDGHDGTAAATVTIAVTGANDTPSAANDVATVAEDGAVAIDVLGNDADVDGDAILITGVGGAGHGIAAVVTSGPDAGRVSYTPQPNFTGTDSFTYTIDDGSGGTATASVAVTVTAVNDVPNAANDGATATGETTVTIDVAANDIDTDGDPLSVVSVGAPANGTATLVTSGPDTGRVSYSAAAGFVGSDSFTYSISDGVQTVTATVTVVVVATPE